MCVDVPQLWTSEPSRSQVLFRMRHRGGRDGARRDAKNGHRDLRGRHRLDGARRKLDPESLRRVMGRYFDAMRGVIERHGGDCPAYLRSTSL